MESHKLNINKLSKYLMCSIHTTYRDKKKFFKSTIIETGLVLPRVGSPYRRAVLFWKENYPFIYIVETVFLDGVHPWCLIDEQLRYLWLVLYETAASDILRGLFLSFIRPIQHLFSVNVHRKIWFYSKTVYFMKKRQK